MSELVPRSDIIAQLSALECWDFCVVGGGAHGLAFARQAARNGFKCCLIEAKDFAHETSSRSSKMLHGGLRYLEMFDFKQVFEGIRSREELLRLAPHLCKASKFHIPVPQRAYFLRLKLSIGLKLYDRFLQDRSRTHRWVPRSKLSESASAGAKRTLMGCYEYTDGIFNDARLAIETMMAAEQAGAVCANYCRFLGSKIGYRNRQFVRFRDEFSKTEAELCCRLVVNCAGPWAAEIDPECSTNEHLLLSRGAHLLYPHSWTGPSLFLPLPSKTRYYFVWPHPSGTMVGTTERVIDEPESDPTSTAEEVQELHDRVRRDLSHTPLCDGTPHYTFVGVRNIPFSQKRSGTIESGKQSRRHRWIQTPGFLTLLGGKWTTSDSTALEGLKLASATIGVGAAFVSHKPPLFPGRVTNPNLFTELREACHPHGGDDLALRLFSRYGRLAQQFLESPDWLQPITEELCLGELKQSVENEKALTISDLFSRRLGLEFMPGSGLRSLESSLPHLPVAVASSREAYESLVERNLDAIRTAFDTSYQ